MRILLKSYCTFCSELLDETHGKRPCVANVAVARELACWVWEVGRRAEGTLA